MNNKYLEILLNLKNDILDQVKVENELMEVMINNGQLTNRHSYKIDGLFFAISKVNEAIDSFNRTKKDSAATEPILE